MTTPEAGRVEEIRARRQRLSSALDDGGDEQALVGGDIDWLLAALTTQAETIRRLEGEVAQAKTLQQSAKILMKHAAQRAEAAEGRVRELTKLLSDSRRWVEYCDRVQREFYGKSMLPAIDAALSPATGEGA